MGFERSDEARREDSLYDRIGSLERYNRQQDEKIVELERIIIDAKECVKITQERNDNLKQLLDDTIAKHNKRMTCAKHQIAVIKSKIAEARTCNNETLEQIENNLKLVKIQF